MTTDDQGPVPMGETTTDLVKQAIDEARELARLEVALAKNDALTELHDLKASAIAFGIAAAAALLGMALLLVALVLALGGITAALLLGVALLVVAGCLVLFALSKLPD